jgi:hypothetical protein
MTKPTGMNRTKLQHIRQESLRAATTGRDRATDPLLMLSPEMIEALEEMLEALPGGRLASLAGCNRK